MFKRFVLLTLTVCLASGLLLIGSIPTSRAIAQDEATPTATGPHVWFHEDFSTRANRWRLFDLSGKSKVAYEEPGLPPGLSLEADTADYALWTLPDSDLRPDHFDLIATLSAVQGGDDSRAGVILSYRSESDMVVLAVSPAGMISLGHFYFGMWTDLVPPFQSGFDPTQPVTLHATLDTDHHLMVIVNGQSAGTTQLQDFRPAGFGLFGLTGQNGGIKVTFRSLVVSDL